MTTITATAPIAHPPARVFGFLADLRNHWRLESAFVALDSLDRSPTPAGGRVRLRGPLGLARVAETRVLVAEPPAGGAARLQGEALVGGRTRARVEWHIAAAGERASRVTLSAAVERATALDRALLVLGGRRWLAAVFARTLRNLDRVLGEEGVPAPHPREGGRIPVDG